MGAASGKAGHDTYILEREGKRFGWLTRRIWLPKIVYDAIPYVYLVCGFSAFVATLYIAEWFWLLPHYLLFSFACVHVSIKIFRLRSSSRKTGAGNPKAQRTPR